MQNNELKKYEFTLTSQANNSFRCQKAAQSVDLDLTKKLSHHFNLTADIISNFNVGLIVGASGSGKTTFAEFAYEKDAFKQLLDLSKPIINQFPENWTYDDCAKALNGAGLSQVPCWIRPAATLSNGQKARAEIALQLATDREIIVIDEFTSVVDRTIAKIMAHTVQKIARRQNRKIVLLSCHYDVIEWLNPCWIVDCNKQEYSCRRSLWQTYERQERLEFTIKSCERASWKYFSKYHYLSEKLAGGLALYYGLYHNNEQIGFQAYTEYTPWGDKKKKRKLHFNRTVIHPDYVGFGLGIKMIDATAELLIDKYEVYGKFSSMPIYKSMSKNNKWHLTKIKFFTKDAKGNINRKTGFRNKVKQYMFKFKKPAK